jgi:hypothetical protein
VNLRCSVKSRSGTAAPRLNAPHKFGKGDLFQRAAIAARCDPGNTPEDASQVMLIGKTARQRHLG